jgi:hypothetical protein
MDYNKPSQGRVTRTVRWWYAPTNVTAKAKKTSRNFLLLVAVVLAGIWAATFFWPAQAPQPQAAVPVPVAQPPQLVSSCTPADAVEFLPEQVILQTFEPVWVRDGSMSRPVSTTGGPFSGDPFPRCFARTPEGALYAASSFATGVVTATDSGDLKPFFEARASHTGNYTAMMARLPTVVPDTDRTQLNITGYRWNSYTPDQVSLEIKFTSTTGESAGQSIATVYTLTWEDNDWLQVVPGPADIVQVPVEDNKPYIPWGTT